MDSSTEISIEVYQPKHPGGRPTDYDPEYCDIVIQLGEQGASIVQMAYACGVCRETLDNWSDRHEEFFRAFKRAKAASQCWWEKAGQTGMFMSGFSAAAWSRSMAARFPHDWQERKGLELTGKDGGPIESRTITAAMSPKEAADIMRQELGG